MSAINPQTFESLPKSKITQKPVIHFAHANGMPSAVYAPFFAPLAEFFTIEYIPMLGNTPDYPVDNHGKAWPSRLLIALNARVSSMG